MEGVPYKVRRDERSTAKPAHGSYARCVWQECTIYGNFPDDALT